MYIIIIIRSVSHANKLCFQNCLVHIILNKFYHSILFIKACIIFTDYAANLVCGADSNETYITNLEDGKIVQQTQSISEHCFIFLLETSLWRLQKLNF